MNENRADEALRGAYRPFGRKHDQHREELLEAISNLGVSSKGSGVRKVRQRLVGFALSVAAMLLIGTTFLVVWWSSAASPAVAMERVRERFLGLQSLYLKGWIFQTIEKDGELRVERFSHEFYAERPSRYWYNAYGFSFEGNQKLTQVTHSYSASDGERSTFVSHDRRMAIIRPANQLNAELATEQLLQATVFDRLVVGIPESYRYVGKEETQGRKCDVYECREASPDGLGHRRRLWLDAGTGMPVRVKCWTILGSRVEEPAYEYDTIRINGSPPEGMFSFDPPEEYQVTEIEGEAAPLTLPDGVSAAGAGLSFYTWVPFSVDDRAVLYCWWVDPPVEEKGLLRRMPEFSLGQPGKERPCRYVPLRTDPRWHWAMLLPSEDGEPIDLDDQLAVVLKGDRARLESGCRPLRLPPEQLERILLEAQRSTIPAGSEIEPFTLEELRELIRPDAPQIEMRNIPLTTTIQKDLR